MIEKREVTEGKRMLEEWCFMLEGVMTESSLQEVELKMNILNGLSKEWKRFKRESEK